MAYGLLADLVVLVHLAFVAFVALGGLLVWRWQWLMWVHLPAVAWGVGIAWTGGICPLTPLENWLRLQAGQAAYPGDFIERYMLPVLYPAELSRAGQIMLGVLALAINATAYGALWFMRHRARHIRNNGGGSLIIW